MAKKKPKPLDPAWIKAKKACRLSHGDIRKAKRLGMTPQSLLKNIPSSSEQWKLHVKEWIRVLYAEKYWEEYTPPGPSQKPKKETVLCYDGYLDDYHPCDGRACYCPCDQCVDEECRPQSQDSSPNPPKPRDPDWDENYDELPF